MTVAQALFSFEGRMSRRDYWLKGVLVLLPIAIFTAILYQVNDNRALVLAMIIDIVTAWPALALVVKRLHDHNRSGWVLATLLIPIVNIIFAMCIGFAVSFCRGIPGPNRFGDDPVPEST